MPSTVMPISKAGNFSLRSCRNGERRVAAVLQSEDDLNRAGIVLGAKGRKALREPGLGAVKRLQEGDRLGTRMRVALSLPQENNENGRQKIKTTEARNGRAYAGDDGYH